MNRKSRDDMISRDFAFVLTRFHEIFFLCWPDFTWFRLCVDPISRDMVFALTWFHDVDPISRDFAFVLTLFHETSYLRLPDFTRFGFCVNPISRDLVFALTRFHEIYSRHHRIFDFCYNLAPQYTASLCALHVCAAEYSWWSHTGTRLSLLICCSNWLVITQHPSTSFNHIESPWWCKHAN